MRAQLEKWCVIQLTECLCNLVQNKKVCIMLQMQVQHNPGVQIGHPTGIDASGNIMQAPAPAAEPDHQMQQQQQQQQQQRQPKLLHRKSNWSKKTISSSRIVLLR